MIDNFMEQQKNKIIEHWGYDFYRIVHYTLENLSEKWKLSDLEFFSEYCNGNAIFFYKSDLHGDCVLKINRDGDESLCEYNALREYDGGRFVKAYEVDEYGVVLVERAIPGKTLSDEPSLEKRLAVFSELFNGRHVAPKNPRLFDTYENNLNYRINCIENKSEDFKELYVHAAKVREFYTKIASVYDRMLLIHLDIGGVNIVSCGNGQYKMIDPWPAVLGDPVFEIGRFLFVECYNNQKDRAMENTEKALDYLEKSLNIPNEILRQCLYIENVLRTCERTQWCGQWWGSGRVSDRVLFAEKLMNEN